MTPSSSYRIQVNKEFPLAKVIKIIPYLYDLGIEAVYCSPLFEAFSSSYDITNPNKLNPDLGTEEEFNLFCDTLKKHGMQHILDVVPNHMGIKGDKNKWWLDVLENGQGSSFAEFFDINWMPEKREMQGKILLPILKDPYGKALEKGDIKLAWKEGFWIIYADFQMPLCKSSYPRKEEIEEINQNKDKLHELLEKQFYRLSYWVDAGQEINYRRFFNINELIAIHIEKERVFKEHNYLVFEWLKSGKVQGIRVDHPDGLYNPRQYFERLNEKKPEFVWAEKILDFGEKIHPLWKVDGTVGYDFLNVVSGLFVQKKNEKKILDTYFDFIKDEFDFKEINYLRRKSYLVSNMASEVNFLGQVLDELSEKNRYFRDLTKIDLTKACLEVMACFPVYRTYVEPGQEIRKKDREYILKAVNDAKNRTSGIDPSVFEFIQKNLLLEYPGNFDFVMRFQQLTPTVMAKGLEDSTFFIYNPLISLNEVGDNPHHFGCTKEEFHKFNQEKLKSYPLGALATSTHDTKYSEDARLRIHVLSELPKKWHSLVNSWKKINQKHKTSIDGVLYPTPNTEYLFYQMLLGIWPADKKRIWTCLQKAMREAGIHTSWTKVDKKKEKAAKHFLEKILKKGPFLSKFNRFQKEISELGVLNSLSALILKIGSAGIADFYQGNICLNYCLMDPDNRRKVNYSKKDLKREVTKKALTFRRKHKELFLSGEYIPLKTPENIIAFERRRGKEVVIIAVKRFFSDPKINGTLSLPSPMQDIFTGRAHKKGRASYQSLLKNNSFVLLKNQAAK